MAKSTKVLQADNVKVLNAIRGHASTSYYDRVPCATQGSIQQTLDSFLTYTPLRNEFLDGLINQIGDVWVKNRLYNNPLAIFKRGLMSYGASVEEVFVDLVKAKAYSVDSCCDLTGCGCNPDIDVAFHQVNLKNRYCIEINEDMLRQAFLNDTGLSSLINRLLEAPYNSLETNEYLTMRQLITEYLHTDHPWFVQIPDLGTTSQCGDRQCLANEIAVIIREWIYTLQFQSSQYNPMGVTTFTRPEDLVLFCTPRFRALMDNVLAFTFNTSYAEIDARIIVVDSFDSDGVEAVLADRDFFVCMDTLRRFENFYNPACLARTYYLHHWGIYSTSKFANFIAFTTGTASVVVNPPVIWATISVNLESCTGTDRVSKGSNTKLYAIVTGTTSQGEGDRPPCGIMWSLRPDPSNPMPIAPDTFIGMDGVLHVSENETADTFEVVATVKYDDPTKEGLDPGAVIQGEGTMVMTVDPVPAGAGTAQTDCGCCSGTSSGHRSAPAADAPAADAPAADASDTDDGLTDSEK